MAKEDEIKDYIKTYPDWPVKGVDFKDTSSLCNGPGYRLAQNYLYDKLLKYKMDLDRFVGVDARGFIFGGTLAWRMNKPLVLARKKGKLPGAVHSQEFQLEYGSATMELQSDAIHTGENIIIVDDLLATGGTALSVINIIQREWNANVIGFACVVNLPELGGEERIKQLDIPVIKAVEYLGS
ncbi:MAG: adenine phosphoribosyltransferase [Euryarchaeota archaeon]|jgi:adenine phosphoribosyltransferase|nr:adenine phosphoribosyltransferase [Euryarchaeota archaeon]